MVSNDPGICSLENSRDVVMPSIFTLWRAHEKQWNHGAVGNEAAILHVRSSGGTPLRMALNVEVEAPCLCCKQEGNLCWTHSSIIIFQLQPRVTTSNTFSFAQDHDFKALFPWNRFIVNR